MRLQAFAAMMAVVACIAATSGCNSQSSGPSVYAAADASGWLYGDTLHLTLEQEPDSVIDGRLAIAVRHTASYKYSNLWLELSYGDSIAPDTINVRLADMYGNWYGTGLGLSYQCVDTLGRRIAAKAPLEIGIRHIMRVDRLSDVEQIGVIVMPDDTAANDNI